MIDEKMDVLIEHMNKLKKGRVNEMQLMALLDQCYSDILPPVAKMFVRRGRFVSLLMERKLELLKKLNGAEKAFLRVVQ